MMECNLLVFGLYLESGSIIVYPMNALINSQFEAIEANKTTYENTTGKVFPFSFARYTSQESTREKDIIREVKFRLSHNSPHVDGGGVSSRENQTKFRKQLTSV
jgi:ATP-dependent helicase YprA (DUF1998 family)